MTKIFKISFALISIWFLTINLNDFSVNNDKEVYLIIDGKISYEDDERITCRVDLFCNNTLLDSIILNGGKTKFKFNLNRNEYYTIKISKKDCIDRIVCINTAVPIKEKDRTSSHKFKFFTKLNKKESLCRLNKDALDYPIAIIAYNSKKERFTYYKKYTSRIKKELSATKSS